MPVELNSLGGHIESNTVLNMVWPDGRRPDALVCGGSELKGDTLIGLFGPDVVAVFSSCRPPIEIEESPCADVSGIRTPTTPSDA